MMLKKNSSLNNRVREYVEDLFSDAGESQQLFDLKEELVINMRDKIDDYKSKGMDDDQAFKEAVVSMGDLSGLVEDMREIGKDKAKQEIYSTMTARISTAGIIAGSLLILFGIFTVTMLYLMENPRITATSVAGNGIFIVAGGILLTYSVLTRETSKKFAMNRIRAALYALSIGLLLFGLFTSSVAYFETIEAYIPVSSLMIFFLPAIGLFLYLRLTGADRSKKNK